MKNRIIIGLCMMFLLVLPISFSITTYEETSTVSRIVGESPTEMLRQMQKGSIDIDHVTHFGYTGDHSYLEKQNILTHQFVDDRFTALPGWKTDDVDNRIGN